MDYTTLNNRNGDGFNLIADRWLPFGRDDISIREAMSKAHELPSWPVLNTPQVNSAIIRLLTVLAYRIAGIDDKTAEDAGELEETLERLSGSGSFDDFRNGSVGDYLDQWKDRFWLLPPADTAHRPFLQDPALVATMDEKDIGGIVASRLVPDASPSYVWGQQQVGPITPAEAARQLLAFMFYGPGGGGPKHPLHQGKKINGKERVWQAGRLRGKVSIHPRGRNLYETLLLHLVPLETTGGQFIKLGLPDWELDEPPDLGTDLPPPTSLLEQLFGRWDKTALLILSPDGGSIVDAKLATGRRREVSDDAENDPYTLRCYTKSKEGDQVVDYLEPDFKRDIWRDVPNLRAKERQSPTPVVSSRLYLPGEVCEWVTVTHCPKRGQAKDVAWWQSSMPAVSLLDDDAYIRCCNFVAEADEICKSLLSQTAKTCKAAISSNAKDAKPYKDAAESNYWSTLEPQFADAVEHGHKRDILVSAARAAFDKAMEPLNGRFWERSRGQHQQAPVASVLAKNRQQIGTAKNQTPSSSREPTVTPSA